PEPLEEPPEKKDGSQGLRAGGKGKSNEGPPKANSWQLDFPNMIAPASFRRRTTAASNVATLPLREAEAPVAGRPATSATSLMESGIPASGPTASPAASRLSRAAADSSAASGVGWLYPKSAPSKRAIRSR